MRYKIEKHGPHEFRIFNFQFGAWKWISTAKTEAKAKEYVANAKRDDKTFTRHNWS